MQLPYNDEGHKMYTGRYNIQHNKIYAKQNIYQTYSIKYTGRYNLQHNKIYPNHLDTMLPDIQT